MAFTPGKNNISTHLEAAGSANGKLTLNECFYDSEIKIVKILDELKIKPKKYVIPKIEKDTFNIDPFWFVKSGKKRKWVDLQNDVTVKDIKIAVQEGFHSVELLKRSKILNERFFFYL